MTPSQTVLSRYKESGRNLDLETTRHFMLPKEVRGTEPNVDSEGTDLAIWKYEGNNRLYAIAFQGKAGKPLWHHAFRNEAARQGMIDETIADRKGHFERKLETQKQRREYTHDYKEGDILYTSWGYDQTNVDWYQVVEVRGADLMVRPIASKDIGRDQVVADPGQFIKPAIRVRATLSGVKVESHRAYKWDGKPQYETPFGYGH